VRVSEVEREAVVFVVREAEELLLRMRRGRTVIPRLGLSGVVVRVENEVVEGKIPRPRRGRQHRLFGVMVA